MLETLIVFGGYLFKVDKGGMLAGDVAEPDVGLALVQHFDTDNRPELRKMSAKQLSGLRPFRWNHSPNLTWMVVELVVAIPSSATEKETTG